MENLQPIKPPLPSLGLFKSWLSLWILIAMGAGLALGIEFPAVFETLGALSVSSLNPVTAALVWLLIVPSMVQINYSKLGAVWSSKQWRAGSAITLMANWLIKPFSLAVLAYIFVKIVFGDIIPQADADQYIAGLILLGVAPCAGMVFVWSRMTGGDPAFTLAQVSLNSLVLLFAFGPIAGLLLGFSGVSIPWETLTLSTFAYVIVPLIGGFALRHWLLQQGDEALLRFDDLAGPLTKIGLLVLVVLLFGFQAQVVISQPVIIAVLAVPLLIQTVLIFAVGFIAAWTMRLPSRIGAPAALIGTSNFFELAVAVAIAVFGVHSPAVIATIVGVLVEVPVMVLLVWVSNAAAAQMDARSQTMAVQG